MMWPRQVPDEQQPVVTPVKPREQSPSPERDYSRGQSRGRSPRRKLVAVDQGSKHHSSPRSQRTHSQPRRSSKKVESTHHGSQGRSSDGAASSTQQRPASPSVSAEHWLKQADVYSGNTTGQLQFLASQLADLNRQLSKTKERLRDAERDSDKWRSRASTVAEHTIESATLQEMKTNQAHLEAQLKDS